MTAVTENGLNSSADLEVIGTVAVPVPMVGLSGMR